MFSDFVKDLKENKKFRYFFICLVLVTIFALCFQVSAKASVSDIKESVVLVEVYDEDDTLISTGSGFCTFDQTIIATNYHVIKGARSIKIVTDDNLILPIDEVLIFSKISDLALLKCTASTLKPIELKNTYNLSLGDSVMTIGSPEAKLNTVSAGNISNLDDSYEIRFTAPISPGSSGGVLIDNDNKVIGITYATVDSATAQNINYAIRSEFLLDLYEHFINREGIKVITTSNYYEYIGSLDKFEDDLNELYYQVSSLPVFYKLTNDKSRFEFLLLEEDPKWFSRYELLGVSKQNAVVSLFSRNSNKNKKLDESIKDSLYEWNSLEFFTKLGFLKDYEYVIIATELKNVNDFGRIKEKINMYSLSDAQKAILSEYILGIDSSLEKDKKEVVNYIFSRDFSLVDSKSLLEFLGYKVNIMYNNKLIVEW